MYSVNAAASQLRDACSSAMSRTRHTVATVAAAEAAIVTTTMMMLTMITLSRWGAEYERVCLSRVYPFAHLGNYTFQRRMYL